MAEITDNTELRSRILIFNGFSKCVSMAGNRVAYMLCHNQDLLQRIYSCQV
jgi:aspartate/methionine/tyrosine aminotransferase